MSSQTGDQQKGGLATAVDTDNKPRSDSSAVDVPPTSSSSSQANIVGNDPTTTNDEEPPTFRPTLQFWIVFLALLLATLLSALDGAIVATALPTISNDLNVGPDFVWVANVYFLTG